MEDYNNQVSDNNNETASRGSFLYSTSYSHNNNQLPISFHQHNHLQTSDHGYPSVKMEAGNSEHKFQYPFINRSSNHHQQEERREENENLINGSADEAIKAKIIAHPQYSSLLQAYMDCQKVGAPAEVVARLTAVRQEFEATQSESGRETCKDPELNQFMEAYYDMLVKYREELTRPLQEAMEFMRRIETQLNMLNTGPLRIFSSDMLMGFEELMQMRARSLMSNL